MNLRQQREDIEEQILSPYACLNKNSKGRTIQEEPCDIRTNFQRDRDRVIHSKAFRRLKHKTQVFISPEGDHYRTRLTHTLEVAQIARTIARALRLNEDLTEAIALAHDLGHTPFGHAGEHALEKVCPLGFKHYEQSLRVVEKLENKGKGLNLSWEVKDGILNHPTAGQPITLEGKIVRLSDKIAYINHDIDDAIRGKILKSEELPDEYTKVLGKTSGERIDNIIHNIVNNSINNNDITMSPDFEEATKNIRKYMFMNVYVGSTAKKHERKAQNIIIELYNHFVKNYQELPIEYQQLIERNEEPVERIVCDYIAGMTDRFAIKKFAEIFVPTSWDIY
ncbi:dGTPase [Natranaerovirga pectinivora]|uniref:Deoxyguanosinetriphosphate triphosphohydrolase-like protein n=1 Tax=Natranaerovirga pectinivora TaxID=682400 RepID=A0A4R3MQY1_9FIRM|nr:deoxyguanosinetriphosphate triphosphohydrolase [Natranaerovirga pectinivora]TCT15581.1 dGTPase [Natranaerovirga pectinivora]